MQKLILATVALAALAACGGSSGTPTIDVPVSEDDQVSVEDVDGTPTEGDFTPVDEVDPTPEEEVIDTPSEVDPADETTALAALRVLDPNGLDYLPILADDSSGIRIEIDGELFELEVFDDGELKPFKIASATVDGVRYISSVSDVNGVEAGYVTTLNQGDGVANEGLYFAERLTETTLPVSGSATFDGVYQGVVAGSIVVRGDAFLETDFEDGTIGGAVYNRAIFLDNLENPSDQITTGNITLETTTIDEEGAFSGTIIGGDFLTDEDSFVSSGGTFGGLITGLEGDGAAGGLLHTLTVDGETVVEVGSFILE